MTQASRNLACLIERDVFNANKHTEHTEFIETHWQQNAE